MKPGYMNVKDFGALGDGQTNDTAAIRAAISEAARYANSVVCFPPANGYAVSDTITVPPGIDVIMDAPLIFTSANSIPALVIGTARVVNDNRTFVLNVIRRPISNWPGPNLIGIKLMNANTCDIRITQVNGFTIGLQCIGDAQGFAYNQVSLGYIMNNQYGVDLTNIRQGWCNENLFLGGRISAYSGTNPGVSRYGVRITSQDGAYRNNNNNVFQKPSFEMYATVATPGESIPILIEHGVQNAFYSCRYENSGPYLARVTNQSAENVFEVGYSSGLDVSIDDQSTYPTSLLTIRRTILQQQNLREVFISGPVHKTACFYDGSTRIQVPRLHIAESAGASANVASTNLAITPNYLEVRTGRGLGIFVDTNATKQFAVSRNVVAGYGGRVAVRCYNASGAVITGEDFIRGYNYYSPYLSSDYGGVYITGSDSDNDYYFEVSEAVKSIAVILCGGSRPLRIKSFSISTIQSNCATWSGYEEMVPGSNIGETYPTAGTWERGRRIFNALPGVQKPNAWVCVASGTPGTWRPTDTIV